MTILTRYIVFELGKVFVLTLAGMTLLMILVGVVQEAVRESLTPLAIVQLIPFVLPNALCFAIPGTVLFAVCNVYGRMSASGEVIALESLGIAPMTAIWPALIASFVLSLGTVWLNDIAVSWGRQGVFRVILHSVESTIYSVLESQRTFTRGRVTIVVEDVVDGYLIRPVIERHGDSERSRMTIIADRARLGIDPEAGTLVFTITNGHIDWGGVASLTLDEKRVEIPLVDATRRTDHESPSNLPLRTIGTEVVAQRQQIEETQRGMAVDATASLLIGDLVALTDPDWIDQYARLENDQGRLNRLLTEPWRRWANGFSCLCFVMIGAPLAILLRKGDFWTSFAVCFIPILLAYYPLLMLGISQTKSGALPPQAVWIGNFAIALVGVWLMNRLQKT